MKKFNNKSGFTLIEIIVVLIIVGILAAIALPNLFSNVSKGKASTAVAALDAAKTAFETCATQNNVAPGTAPCAFTTVSTLPTASVNAINGFYFGLGAATAAAGAATGSTTAPGGTPQAGTLVYSLIAQDGTNTIGLNRSATGVFTCSAPNVTTNPYYGVC